MILTRENPFPGPLEGVDPENLDFFGPWNGNYSECHLGQKKSSFKGPPLSMARVCIFLHQNQALYLKKTCIGNFINIRFACSCVGINMGGGGGEVAISGPKKVDGVIHNGFTAVLYFFISIQSAS